MNSAKREVFMYRKIILIFCLILMAAFTGSSLFGIERKTFDTLSSRTQSALQENLDGNPYCLKVPERAECLAGHIQKLSDINDFMEKSVLPLFPFEPDDVVMGCTEPQDNTLERLTVAMDCEVERFTLDYGRFLTKTRLCQLKIK